MYNRRAAFKKGGAFMSKYSDYMFQKHTKMFIELEKFIEPCGFIILTLDSFV